MLTYRSAARYFVLSHCSQNNLLPYLQHAPHTLLTDRIIDVLLSFSRLLGAVASTCWANSCSRSACVSKLQGGTKGPLTDTGWRSFK